MTTKEILDKILLRKFCCCMSLELGCKAIGALEWMATLFLSCRYSDFDNLGEPCLRARLSKIPCSMIFYNILSFVVSVSICSGISKKCREYFLPWLLIKTIEYIVFTVILIYELNLRFVMNVEILYLVALVVSFMILFFYSWLCVFSLYFRMESPDDMKPLEQNSYTNIPQETPDMV